MAGRYGALQATAPQVPLSQAPPPQLASGPVHQPISIMRVPSSKLSRQPTFAAFEAERRKSQSMPTFADVDEDFTSAAEGGVMSERAATRSWSISGGFREASFKKKPGELKRTPSALGFAAVLSVSGWSEHDAEEMEMDATGHEPEPSSAAAEAEGSDERDGHDATSASFHGRDTTTSASFHSRLQSELRPLHDGQQRQQARLDDLEHLLRNANAQLGELTTHANSDATPAGNGARDAAALARVHSGGLHERRIALGVGLGCCGDRRDAKKLLTRSGGEVFSTPLLGGLLRAYHMDGA